MSEATLDYARRIPRIARLSVAVATTRPSAEIAAELGLSTAAVRQAKYRVLRRLRTEVEGLL